MEDVVLKGEQIEEQTEEQIGVPDGVGNVEVEPEKLPEAETPTE